MNVLIVEDEMLVACDLQDTIEELGHVVVGIAPDTETAMALSARGPDLALVDLNLRDGETGPAVGTSLSAKGIEVIFVTGNPRAVGDGVRGTLGVYTKPMDRRAVTDLIAYAEQILDGDRRAQPPSGLYTFGQPYPDA